MINIIYPKDHWILQKMGEELLYRIPNTRGIPHTSSELSSDNSPLNDPAVQLNYYINYPLFRGKTHRLDVALFTHPEPNGLFYKLAQEVDLAICISEKYRKELTDQGSNAVTIIPGIGENFNPKLIVGFVGRFSSYGERKGDNILSAVSEIEFVDLRLTNGQVHEKDLPDFYNQLDCVLIASKYEGGPMCLLEGLAMGKPIVCPPDIGLAETYIDHILPYENSNFTSLKTVLETLYESKKNRYDAVAENTWKNWAKKHKQVFDALIENNRRQDWLEVFKQPFDEANLIEPVTRGAYANPVINRYAEKHGIKEINLHLGCGGHNLANWINIDNFDYVEGDNSRSGSNYDIKMDIRELDVSDNTVDCILLVHVIEHFVRWQTIDMLKHYYQKLKSGGFLYIEMPDLDGCISWCQKGKKAPHIDTPIGPLNMGFTQLYGNQWDRLDYETHRYVWTKNEIGNVLKDIGFQILQLNNEARYHHKDRDMFVTAQKPNPFISSEL